MRLTYFGILQKIYLMREHFYSLRFPLGSENISNPFPEQEEN